MRVLANALLVVAIPALLGFGPTATQAEITSPMQEWSFDHEQPGILPSQFSIGTMFDGRTAGDWQVLVTDRAKCPPYATPISGVVAVEQNRTERVRKLFVEMHSQAMR